MGKMTSDLSQNKSRVPVVTPFKLSKRADKMITGVRESNSFLVCMSPRNLAFNYRVGFEVFYNKIIFKCKLQLCTVTDIYSPVIPWEKIPINGFFILGMMPVMNKSDKRRKILILRRTTYGENRVNVFELPDDTVWPGMVFLFRTQL